MSPSEEQHAFTNQLIHEKSPYLLQHAHNPVNWYPWGEEALDRARVENKPIFLSIGYSTCHWCHVMERESFENPEIAALMNEYFVCIKVDREERPDLDEIYMAAVQAMTGSGGWPLSVWLTPELEPFYGGTYFPPDDRFGRPGFKRTLGALAEAFRDKRSEVEAAAGRLGEALSEMSKARPISGELDRAAVDRAFENLARIFDPEHGGWGSAPKFPRSDFGSLCLRVYQRSRDSKALAMVTRTLDEMERGGIYDQLGGGFHRYSTDARWLVPHFEKMLYDNAQLAFHYTEAYQLTKDPAYARVVRGTLDYVLRDMTHPEGAFYSAEDADSEGEEGLFYVWSVAEIRDALPEELAAVFVDRYGVTEQGNWEGHNILSRVRSIEEVGELHDLSVEETERRLDRAREILLALRSRRIRPALDDKILTAWNGLMIRAFARAAVVLEEPLYLQAGERAARFVLRKLRNDEGLLRRWRDGEGRFPAYAEDYAMFVQGLLELYQADFDLDFLEAARELHRQMEDRFADPADGALFNTTAGNADLLVRVKTGTDGSVPTANSVAASNAMSLYELTGEDLYRQQVELLLRAFGKVLQERSLSMATMLLCLDSYFGERVELVLAGDPGGHGLRDLLHRARSGYQADLFISAAPEGDLAGRAVSLLPSLEGKVSLGAPTAYVCRGFACRRPTTDPKTMVEEIAFLPAPTPGGE